MSAYSSQNVKKFKKVENIVKWTGVALAIASVVVIYLKSSSVWLAVFGFILVAKFFGGELPHIIYHKKRIRQILVLFNLPPICHIAALLYISTLGKNVAIGLNWISSGLYP